MKTETAQAVRSMQDLGALMASERAAKAAATAPEPEDETGEGPDPEPEPEEAPVIGDREEAIEPEPEEAPVPDAPKSWPADRLEDWAALSDSAREFILKRERETHAAISERGRKAAEAEEAANRKLSEYSERARKLDELFPQMVETLTGKWAGVDWLKLSREDPERYIQMQAELRVDQEKLNRAAQEKARKDQDDQRREFESLIARNPQYSDRELIAKEAAEVERFLTGEGIDASRLQSMSAVEYELARDAMKFRNALKTRQEPQKQPPQKTARPTARPSNADAAKKSLETQRNKVKQAAELGRNAQDRELAKLFLAERTKRV
jgi:hypothetical protein